MGNLTRQTRSRARILRAGRQVIQSGYEDDSWRAEAELGTLYGELNPKLEAVEGEMNSGDLSAAKNEANELVLDGLFLLATTMISADLLQSDMLSKDDLRCALYFGVGAYMEQEDKKSDQWVDESYFDIYRHTKHEISEIQRNINQNNLDFLVHNSTDFVILSIMLLESVSGQVSGDS